jgi:hypothetical protein
MRRSPFFAFPRSHPAIGSQRRHVSCVRLRMLESAAATTRTSTLCHRTANCGLWPTGWEGRKQENPICHVGNVRG